MSEGSVKPGDPNAFKLELSDVEIIGFSFGAHIGSYACKKLKEIAVKETWNIKLVEKLTGNYSI